MLFERSVATAKQGMEQVFGALVQCRVALEVGTHSPWVSRPLKRQWHEVIVANARQVKLITESSRKSDQLDAQLLRPIRHRSEDGQLDLTQIRVRAALVEARTSLINAARGWRNRLANGCRRAMLIL